MLFKCINLKRLPARYKHTQVQGKATKSYSQTIILPKTKLPLYMQGQKLIERDKIMNQTPAVTELYSWQQTALKGPEFVLHDGPPYANGVPHIGHVINKVLKDTIIRSNILDGRKVHFIPGWDCHGLPIELKAITDTNSKVAPLDIRQKARNFAKQTIVKQKEAFKSWGVIGDWENYYTTYTKSYMKNEITNFFELWNKQLVYRDVKPVYWSPSSRTALAESELEYNNQHSSMSLFLKLKLHKIPQTITTSSNVFALIWTTTPWSLPSNQAICFNSELLYSVVQGASDTELYIIATNLVENLSKKLNSSLNIVNTFPGHLLNGATYHHPLNHDIILQFLPGQHASDDKGTGLVHTAPAHGPFDFLVALKNKLVIVNLVDEAGCYNSDAGSDLEGLFVLTEGTKKILNMVKHNIVHVENYIHSYPYDWRTKKPIIIRASKQWFIDTNSIKGKAIELVNDVKILPKVHSEKYKNDLVTNLQKRPYWCISRQRCWGVPIPVFYNRATGDSIVTRETIDHLCKLIDDHGPDCWWTLPIDKLIPANVLEKLNIAVNDVEKANDIFDIWFDSGLSWENVLEKDKISDLYLEGLDQFNGWFQSSLLTSAALRGKSPYKSIYVHGFAVDAKGLKMSKSLGNVVDPLDILQGKNGYKVYGIDALRWWVVCHANSDPTAHVSENVLQASFDEVHKIRSTMRFALGALHDYKEQSSASSLLLIDRYLLHLLWNYNNQISRFYKDYEFSKISKLVTNFLTNPVSALYYTAIKDRLYCNAPDSLDRSAAQFVLLKLFRTVVRSIAPIVPHLAEELHMHCMQNKQKSVFQENFKLDCWMNENVAEIMENTVLEIKSDINKDSDKLNKKLYIGLSGELISRFKDADLDICTINQELTDIFQVAEVHISENKDMEGFNYTLQIEESNLHVCDRCRRVFAKTKDELCERCKDITSKFFNKVAQAI